MRPRLPRTLQGRLVLALISVVALTLALVAVIVFNRLDEYFLRQEQTNLDLRSTAVANVVINFASQVADEGLVVSPDGKLNPSVQAALTRSTVLSGLANQVAQANVSIVFGTYSHGASQDVFVPGSASAFTADLTAPPGRNQARDTFSARHFYEVGPTSLFPWAIQVTLSDPYTMRANTLATVAGLLVLAGLVALLVAIGVGSLLARRFTAPLRRLTDASRSLAEGDLSRRVPERFALSGPLETAELSRQFNAMADRVQETMEIIRRDRDRSRDFLADVSHELRTPLAALRTFNELLQEGAADDPDARAEFLESSRQQIERLDWLAHNLLELSKLDSGLLQLDLRPEDLRATVASAVEQAELTAHKRGIRLVLRLPPTPLRLRHDPPRIGQVLGNLLGNALKFTPRNGSVTVELGATPDGARILVADSGIGIDAAELPHVFERFYRGSLASEARGSGSGLGLAIARSIVEMHGGRISVESRLGHGSTFTVRLPRDPRRESITTAGPDADAAARSAPAGAAAAGAAAAGAAAAGATAAGAAAAGPTAAGAATTEVRAPATEASRAPAETPGPGGRQAAPPEETPSTEGGDTAPAPPAEARR